MLGQWVQAEGPILYQQEGAFFLEESSERLQDFVDRGRGAGLCHIDLEDVVVPPRHIGLVVASRFPSDALRVVGRP